MANQNQSFTDKLSNQIMKLAEPMSNIAEIPAVAAVQHGLITVLPITIIGSLFLLLSTFASPLTEGSQAILGFLSPWAEDLLVVYLFTMNLLSLYTVVTIAMSYAELKGNVPEKSAGVLALAAYLLSTYNGLEDGMIPAFQLGSNGLFSAIIIGLLSTKIYSLMIEKNIVIKMPEGVPPAIAGAFNGLIPFVVVFTLTWGTRTVIDFDFQTWLTGLMAPIIGAADNIVVFTLTNFLKVLLWSVGLHGDNMVMPAITPFLTQWVSENANAVEAGGAIPHFWTEGVDRITIWPATIWPLVILMLRSKVRYLRTFGRTTLPSSIFTIVEPVMFGLPVMLNPYLLVPFVLSAIVACIITYGSMKIGFVTPLFAQLPWVTPPFIIGPLASGGDWKWLIVLALNVGVGLLIYLPFWRVFEKIKLAEQNEQDLEVKENEGLEASQLEQN